jgi:hypothetical protein
MINMQRYYSIFLIFIELIFFGCASTAPLPETLNIVPPASDVSPEISAFSGIWQGRYYNGTDIALVVEKIDNKKAEVIVSMGNVAGWYQYMEAEVIPGPALYATATGGNTLTFTMKNENELYILTEEERTGAKFKGQLSRLKLK